MTERKDSVAAETVAAIVRGTAKFGIGQVVKHRVYPFRGVIFDVDPTFNNTEEWWQSIPAEVRPRKDQPFYHLLAENEQTTYVAYVSEQNLLPDETGKPCRHPLLKEMLESPKRGVYRMKAMKPNLSRPRVPTAASRIASAARCAAPLLSRGCGRPSAGSCRCRRRCRPS